MVTLRIYDLTVDLQDLLRLMAPRSLQSNWTISSVKSSIPGHGWFEATSGRTRTRHDFSSGCFEHHVERGLGCSPDMCEPA